MRKYTLIGMLFMLISVSVFIHPSGVIAQHSFDSTGETVIAENDVIADSDVITEPVHTLIQKWQTDILFPPKSVKHVLKGNFIPFKFISHASLSTEIAGFINVMYHQSNYLS